MHPFSATEPTLDDAVQQAPVATPPEAQDSPCLLELEVLAFVAGGGPGGGWTEAPSGGW